MADLTRLQVSQPVQLVDANDLQVCDITTVAPSGTETGIVVRNIPSGTQSVSGTITATPNGTYTVAPTGTQAVSGTITATPTGTYTVTGTVSPTGTQAVSGTVTATPTGTYTVGGALDVSIIQWNSNDTVYTASDVSQVSNGGTLVNPKYAAFGAATLGDNTLISAVVGKKIRVIAMMGVVSAATNIYFTSGAAGTVIFGGSTNKINLSANGGFVLPLNELGWFETASNSALVVNLSAANSFSGGITYLEI